MTNEDKEAIRTTTASPSSPKDEQDQVFGRQAEERKRAAEKGSRGGAGDEDRPAESHAGGKA